MEAITNVFAFDIRIFIIRDSSIVVYCVVVLILIPFPPTAKRHRNSVIVVFDFSQSLRDLICTWSEVSFPLGATFEYMSLSPTIVRGKLVARYRVRAFSDTFRRQPAICIDNVFYVKCVNSAALPWNFTIGRRQSRLKTPCLRFYQLETFSVSFTMHCMKTNRRSFVGFFRSFRKSYTRPNPRLQK